MSTLKNDKINGSFLQNISPWILATACTLLLALLALFAVSNFKREKELIVEALNQKGLTLMRFINSSVRASMRDNLRSSREWVRWEERMQAAVDQAVEQPGVEYVLLMDSSGEILSGAGENLPENKVDSESLAYTLKLRSLVDNPFLSRIIKNVQGDKKKFQLVSWYLPPEIAGRPPGGSDGKPGRRQMMGRFNHHPQFAKVREEKVRLQGMKPIYVVQLDFEQFSSPLKRQFLQIVILLIVILLVGIGGALSLVTLKGLRKSEHRLGEMRAFTDILVSSLPIGLIATDSSGVIQVCNAAAREIININEEMFSGRTAAECLPLELARMLSGNAMAEKTERQSEIQLDLQGSKSRVLHLSSMSVLDWEGGFGGEVLLIQDFSEIKFLEKELRRNERLAALGKMAAGVAHELRNPLSSIKGLAVLLKSKFSASTNEATTSDILVKEVERLNRSIGELLDYAKPGKLKKEFTSLEEIINKTVSLVQVDAESYGISIRLEFSDDTPVIQVDSDKLNQVFLNLFLNSIQAMPQGGDLLVRTETEDQTIVFTIKDTGVGIDPENLGRIFDPYYTTKNDGTGLGLAMSSKIIEEHGGQIEVNSVPNEYTEVRISLPV